LNSFLKTDLNKFQISLKVE